MFLYVPRDFFDLSILVFSAQEEMTKAISQKPRMKDSGLRKAQQVHRENVIHLLIMIKSSRVCLYLTAIASLHGLDKTEQRN